MVLILRRFALAMLGVAILGLAMPLAAHKGREHAEKAAQAAAVNQVAAPTPSVPPEMAAHAMAQPEPASLPMRLLGWTGRMHPAAVHFPLALFPIAWLALLLGRRRRDVSDLIRSLIIVAGVTGLGAAALGWIDAGVALTDTDALLFAHRWLGTAVGLGGALLALYAWRRAASVDSRAMTVGLGLITLALIVQGWLGGAIVHGLEHMAF